LANRYKRTLQDSEIATEKIKNNFDVTAEELERLLLQKERESHREAVQGRLRGDVGGKREIGKAVSKGDLLLKGRNPGNARIQKQEDDVRARMSNTSDTYRKMVTQTQTIRQEYFNFRLPRILRALKECVDEINLGMQYHLSRYAFLYENIVLSDGTMLAPTDDTSSGLKLIIESIDNRSDFKTYMQNYAFAHGVGNNRGPRRDGHREEGDACGYMIFNGPLLPTIPALRSHPPTAKANSSAHVVDKGQPTFGVDLAEQMVCDGEDLPPIMIKCRQAIEKYGLQSQGIYRIGGSVRIAEMKERLDRDLNSVDLDAEEWSSHISNVTSVLKMWLRELPELLLTYSLYKGFLSAVSKLLRRFNERLRHIRLHERVNDLPNPNYVTLKYFTGHLYKVAQHESENAMSIQNLAIVFGRHYTARRKRSVHSQFVGTRRRQCEQRGGRHVNG
ncbi:Rho GTPase activation protein, partial [Sparassis latifolia]